MYLRSLSFLTILEESTHYENLVMNIVKQEKIRKSYRLNPALVEFMERYGKNKRWGETAIIEYALEKLAESEGYPIDNQVA